MKAKGKLKIVKSDEPDLSGKCGSCRYLDPATDGRPFCRRYPAKLVVHNGDIKALYPVVDPKIDWCGCYERSETM